MFPLFFPGLFTFIKSYLKLGIFSIGIVFITGFVSYHYVIITRYEKKFDIMTNELQTYKIEKENLLKKGLFSQESVDEIVKYYERELSTCKSQIKRDGELHNNEIFNYSKKK